MKKLNQIFFFLVIISNIVFNSRYQLHYDEAYYWVFGQNLSMSYFDHPPLLAYMIRFFSMFGTSEFLVRCPALLSTIVAVLMMYKLAKRMWGESVANIAFLLALCSPLIEAMFFISTPDSPLLMFWTISLYCFYLAVFENRPKYMYITGVFIGLGLLSKYTMILIFPSLFLFLLFSNNYRYFLWRKELYLSFLISVITFSPVIIWNYTHHWVSFLFQFHHGVDLSKTFNIGAFLDYLGGQLLISGIFIFLAILYFFTRYIRLNTTDDKLAFMFWPFIFVLAFFGYRGLFQHMEANWPAVAYISGMVLLAYWVDRTHARWVFITSFYLIIIVLVIIKIPLNWLPKNLHNRPEVQIVNAFYGSEQLLDQVKPYFKSQDILLGCDYGNASRAWFYLGLKRVYVLDNFEFAHMYKYWNSALPKPVKSAIYVCDTNSVEELNNLHQDFKSVQLLDVAKYNNRIGERYLYIYRVTN